MKSIFKKLYKVTRIIIIILPFIILGFLIKKDLVLSGHLEFVYDFSEDSPVITNLFPANRMSETYQIKNTENFWQQIQQEPVYFETRLPQKFDTAEVEIIYKNNSQPLVQVGLRTLGSNDWSYDFKPLENQLLDDLDWFKIEDSRGSIWQKQKKYLSWDQFFDQIKSINNLASYNYDLDRKFLIPGYKATDSISQINRTIRGAHSFYTYIKNEALDFTFTIQDINRKDGPDPLTINVYNDQGNKIFAKEISDDGLISKFDVASEKRDVSLKILGLSEGVYRIELDCEDEIFFRQIKTKQQYITFINKLYLADSTEYADGFVDLNYSPITIYSTVPRLGLASAHPKGLQTVGLGSNQSIRLSEEHKNYFVTPQNLPTYIYSTRNDLKIFGRGLMAFSKKMYFNPEIYNLRDFSITPDIDYLVSEYKSPKEANSWKINTVKFNLENAEIQNRKLRFAISIPELNSSNENLDLKQIKVTLDKKPLTYRQLLNKVIKYVFDRF